MSQPDAVEPPEEPPATDLLRRLTGSISHNLNNRLAGVIGCIEWVLPELDPTSPHVERLQAGLSCALQAAELVRRLVMFAFRPAALSNPSLVSLGEVAENAAGRVREQNVPGLSVAIIHETAKLVRGNAILAQIALDQVLQNAIEAMPSGGDLTLRVCEDQPFVCLTIHDTGPGLADQAAAHLFEPFVTTRTSGHLGLGLVLCRDLMEAQGGSVNLTWETGRGTTATLRFPAAGEEAVLPPPSRERASPSSSETLWHVI
jgi:signal transduction histidine kinase